MSQDITPFEFNPEELPREFVDDEWWFLLRAVCKKLGFADTTYTKWGQRLPKDAVKLLHSVDSLGRGQKQLYVNKKGIRIILTSSTIEVAKEVQAWLGGPVLEAIAEDGGYDAPWSTMAQRLRQAEKLEYKNITDMMAESTDYDSKSQIARSFFMNMQDLFHKHVTGMRASQLKATREIVVWEDQTKPPKAADLKIGKNYLYPDEFEISGLTLVAVMSKLRLKFYKKPYTMQEFTDALKKELKQLKIELED